MGGEFERIVERAGEGHWSRQDPERAEEQNQAWVVLSKGFSFPHQVGDKALC